MKNKQLHFFVTLVAVFLAANTVRAAVDNIPPTAPTGLSVSVNQSSKIYLTWSASTDNVGVIGYYVYRNGVVVMNTPSTSALDTVSAGIYFYTVSAYDAANNISPLSNSASVTYQADTTPPSIPGSLSAAMASSSITLSWNASTDNLGVMGYYIYKDSARIITTSTITSTSYSESGFAPGDLHTYSVAAYDASGNTSDRSASITVLFDGMPPTAPLITSINAVSQSEIDISWRASTDNIGVAGYYVYRGGTLIGTVSSTVLQYADTGLNPQTQYSYTVAAYDAVQNISGQNNPTFAGTLPQDSSPPSAPGIISPFSVSSSSLSLSWQSSIDNVGVSKYYIYRNGSQIAVSTSTLYSDNGLTPSTPYKYDITAYDAAGNVSPSSSISITTLSPFAAASAKPVQTTYSASSPSPSASSAPSAAANGQIFMFSLYYGLQNETVRTLQSILIEKGYLGQNYATGFFGSLTQKAVQKFQCDLAIACSGDPQTTGWGFVGPKTRKILNSL